VTRWRVERITGSAGALHAREFPSPLTPIVWVFTVDRPALVLGSTQPDDVVDRTATSDAGVEVARRRSGGGAVWLAPGGMSWVDVLLPRGDPLWDDDVGRAVHWLGDAWAAAIGAAADVHRGGMVCSAESGRACFAGLGPGEVTIGGRKAVGISQRRTRLGARFQCVAYDRWDPGPLAQFLRLSPDALAALEAAGTGLGSRLHDLEEGLLAQLP
jgi:lipoate-protein ligase A